MCFREENARIRSILKITWWPTVLAREIVSEVRKFKTRGGRVTRGKTCDGRNRFDSNFVRTHVYQFIDINLYKYVYAHRLRSLFFALDRFLSNWLSMKFNYRIVTIQSTKIVSFFNFLYHCTVYHHVHLICRHNLNLLVEEIDLLIRNQNLWILE